MQMLFMLELDGYIKCVAGNKYIKRNDIMINQRQELGKEGEDFAADYLQKQGYEIIDRNFECKQGEIDIIAKEKTSMYLLK